MAVEFPSAPPVLQGPRVLLRPVLPDDKRARLALGRDPQFHRMVGGDPIRAEAALTAEDVERWYSSLAVDPLSWVIEVDDRLIGTARLHAVDPMDRRARYAIGIFAPRHRSRGFGKEATRLVLDYAFGTLKLHRVELRVLEFNTPAIAMYERCGFVRQGIEREGAWISGTWHSDVRMSVLADEYSAGGI